VLRILAAPKLSLIDQVGSRKECIAQGRSARSSGIAHLLIGLPIIVEQPIIEELSKAWGFAVAPGVVSSCWESPWTLAFCRRNRTANDLTVWQSDVRETSSPSVSRGDNQI
jgi:hypothetical protein